MAEDQRVQEELEDHRTEDDSAGKESAEKPKIIFPTPEEVAELTGGDEEESVEASPAEEVEEVDIGALKEKAKQADEYFNRLQRLQAEFDNYRKRVARERGELRDWAIRSLVEELVEIMDAFERALHEDHASEVPTPYREGIEMVHRKLTEALARYGLSRLEAVGQTFDPHFHEALTQELNEEYPSGVILDEVKPGYLLGERLLRPSLVRVSAGPGPRDGTGEEGSEPGGAQSER